MKKLISVPLHWLFKSTPGVAFLVIVAGVGGAYAANSGGGQGNATRMPSAAAGVAIPPPGPDAKKLSDADRKSLEAFGACMREKAPQPGDRQPSDPAAGHDAFQAAFDGCKSKLTDGLRTQFEQRQAQEEKFHSCMESNGAKPPADGRPPSKSDLKALRKAEKACGGERPGGAMALCGPPHGGPLGGPGGPGGPGRPDGPPMPPPPGFGAPRG
jgi:hypothetical protein